MGQNVTHRKPRPRAGRARPNPNIAQGQSMPSPFHPRQTGARGRGRGRVCGHRARHRPPPRRAAAGCPRCWRWTLATRPRSAGKLPWPCRPACNPARPAPACPPCLSLITCAPELGTPRSHAQSLPTCAAPNAQMLALAGPAGLRGPFEPQAPRSGRQPDGPLGSSGSPTFTPAPARTGRLCPDTSPFWWASNG